MRRLALALGLIGLAGDAFAADLPLPPIAQELASYIPAFPAYFRWEGVYVGGQVTAAIGNADFTNSTQPLLALMFRVLTLETEQHPSTWQVLGASDNHGTGFGGFAGYNKQFDNTLLGVELNYTRSNLTVVAPSFPIGRQTPTLSNGLTYQVDLSGAGSLKIEDYTTLRARLGWVIDNFMPYATVGVAAGRADIAVSVTCHCVQTAPPPNPNNIQPVDFSFTTSTNKQQAVLFGYAAGGGLDVALTHNLFGRVEYEYVQFPPVAQITSHIHSGRVGFALKF
jgi:opacity protein-like surface antigen